MTTTLKTTDTPEAGGEGGAGSKDGGSEDEDEATQLVSELQRKLNVSQQPQREDEDEESVLQSIAIHRAEEDEDVLLYSSKGPMFRKSASEARRRDDYLRPYPKPVVVVESILNDEEGVEAAAGSTAIDEGDEFLLDFLWDEMKGSSSSGIPLLPPQPKQYGMAMMHDSSPPPPPTTSIRPPQSSSSSCSPYSISIEELLLSSPPSTKSSSASSSPIGSGSQIIIKTRSSSCSTGSQDDPFIIVPVPMTFTVDVERRRIGIQIPETGIPRDHLCISKADAEDTIGIYIQLDPRLRRVIKYTASIQVAGSVLLRSQFMTLQPFQERNSGLNRLLQGCTEAEIQAALEILKSKDLNELLKTYGPNDDTLLSMLCFSKDENPTTRCKVMALTRKVLAHPDWECRANVIKKNRCDIGPLEFAATTNKVYIAPYMAELYYDIGEDIYCTDSKGNTLLHVMARKGDVVASTLRALLEMTFNNGRKAYPSNVKNQKDQLPMHIAALSNTCPYNTIQILYKDYPGSLRSATTNGSLPIHVACQFSTDPNLVATLLHFDRYVVNEIRHDGLTPLHLAASRSHISDSAGGIVALEDESQIVMIQLLLKHGADKGIIVENLTPYDLVTLDRTKVRALLKLPLDSPMNSPLNALKHEYSPSSSSEFESPNNLPMHINPNCSDAGVSYPFSATDSGGSDGEQTNNLDAIAEALYQHPSIQAAVMMADQL